MTTAKLTCGNARRMRSTRSTWGSQSVPSVAIMVSTDGRSRSWHELSTDSVRTWQADRRMPALRASLGAWNTLASKSSSTLLVASGAAKAGSFWPGWGPRTPAPLLGRLTAKNTYAMTISARMPTAQAYLLPARGVSGRRRSGASGSGLTRSSCSNRSAAEGLRDSPRSPKRSSSGTAPPQPQAR